MFVAALASTLLVASSLTAGPIKRARYPSLSPDGASIAFSYQGDVWTVPSAGGRATRLTVHPAAESMPRWSPDGKWIAFTSARHGSLDVFVVDSAGDVEPRRLTFPSSSEYTMGWTPDSKWVLFYTNRWGGLDVMKAPLAGGEAIRVTSDSMEFEFLPTVSPDGKRIAYNYGGGPGNWRRTGMRGSGVADIWVADFTSPVTNARNVTNSDIPEMFPMWSPDGGTIWHVRDAGTPNIWRMDVAGRNARQVTGHSGDRVRWPSLSANGGHIAYEYASDVYVLDTSSGASRKVEITVPADARYNRITTLTVGGNADSFAVSPGLKRLAIGVRGDIVITPEAGGATRLMTQSRRRDSNPSWIDDRRFLYAAHGDHSLGIYAMDVDGGMSPVADGAGDEMLPAVSPDRSKFAFHRDYTEICVMPVGGGEARTVATGYFQGAFFGSAEFSWAPDSKHLVYVDPTTRGGANVVVTDTDTGEKTTVALAAKNVGTAIVTGDLSRVAFVATDFGTADLFIVDLVPDAVTFTEDALDKIDEKKADAAPPKLTIVKEGIENRLRRLTVGGTVDSLVSSPDGKTLFFTQGGQVNRVGVVGGAATPVTTGGGAKTALSVSPDGKSLYYLEAGKVASMSLAGAAGPVRSFSVEVALDQFEEARALFDEIGWAMDRAYYREDHNARNWDRIRAYYRSLLEHAYDRAEFYDLMSEMINELNSSHLGVNGPTQQVQTGDDATAFLGVEPDWGDLERTGEYRVARVFASSPAAHPQTRLAVGDVLVSVDRVPLRGQVLDALLNRKSGKKVVLEVRAANGDLRTVAIKPVPGAQIDDLVYRSFVEEARRLTDKYSGGKLAYLHIRGMSMTYHEQFMREVRTLTQGKEGLLIDVRYNGGGNTAQLALGMLIKRPWLIRTNRGWEGVKVSENLYRGDTVELPSALLINASSFSNAEIMAEGFRALGIGPVVGVRTPGGVIGTGSWSLFDGGSLRVPFAGAYAMNGEDLEGNGRKPDVAVDYDPNARLAGEDPMIKAAVDAVLKRR